MREVEDVAGIGLLEKGEKLTLRETAVSISGTASVNG